MALNEAIRELRGSQSRQAFATALGISITALQNYEISRAPDARALYALLRYAEDNNHRSAKYFRVGLRVALGEKPTKEIVI